MSDQTRDILQRIGGHLDETRDLLDAALEQNTWLDRALCQHEYTARDLHWDAAKVLIDTDPARPALRSVTTSAEQLLEQLRHSQRTAEEIHDKLREAGQHVRHTTGLFGQLRGISDDPDRGAAVAALATRHDHFRTLVELSVPLAERTSIRLEDAHWALEAGLMQSGDLGREQFTAFWSVDRGVFDTARELAQARTTSQSGAELTRHAVAAGTLTAGHTRTLVHQPRHSPAAGPPPAAGPAI